MTVFLLSLRARPISRYDWPCVRRCKTRTVYLGSLQTVLLDTPALVVNLRKYIEGLDYTHGPLFQASKNGNGGPIRYQSVQVRWQTYAKGAGIGCTPHQLRHSHATELVNGGVSLATIRKRLGHQHLQTTLRHAEVSDQTADTELRHWRRHLP